MAPVTWPNAVDDSHLGDGATRLFARMRAFEARFHARFDRLEARILRWMLVLWATTMGTVIALLKL